MNELCDMVVPGSGDPVAKGVISAKNSMPAEIAALKSEILDLGCMVETAISRSITAMIQRDTFLAQTVIHDDQRIDRAEVQLEEHCLRILEHLHPTGAELRFVVAVLKINDALERMGDLAENVAEVVLHVADWDRFMRVPGCRELGTRALESVTRSLRSLVDEDVRLAKQVMNEEDDVDRLQAAIRKRIEREIDVCPENTAPLMQLERVTRQLERVGDLATNVAEDVVYLIEGKIVRHPCRSVHNMRVSHSENRSRRVRRSATFS
jgi:phosphate transport system protein